MAETDKQIKAMLFKRIYRHPDIMRIRAGAAQIVTDLFQAYMANPQAKCRATTGSTTLPGLPRRRKARHVGDYLAGMTDTYAVRAHRRLFDQTPDLR